MHYITALPQTNNPTLQGYRIKFEALKTCPFLIDWRPRPAFETGLSKEFLTEPLRKQYVGLVSLRKSMRF
jgi:hypothetical protein